MAKTSKQYFLTAIIYNKRGRVLSVGKNNYYKTHPVQKKYASRVGQPDREYLHAEIAAIVSCRDLSRAHKISVLRFNRDGSPAPAKPCKICMSAINEVGIKVVDHT